MDFYKIASHLNEIIHLIHKVSSGRRTLEQFSTQYRSKVKILPYPAELIQRLRHETPSGQATGSCFIQDGKTGTIYYDPNTPIGILAPFILHELTHATDPELWKAVNLPKSSERRREILINTEISAFKAQHRFIQELKNEYQSYVTFIDQLKSRMPILTQPMSSEEIRKLYSPII